MLVHQHFIARVEAKNPPKDPDLMVEWVRRLVSSIGMKILKGPFAEYLDVPGNRGITAVCIIETSHIAVHVWDETDPALMQVDVYSCGELDPGLVFEALSEFDITSASWKFLDRETGLEEVNRGQW